MAEPFNQNWFGGAGDPKGLQPQNNLSDLDNPEEARKFLGLIGTGDVKKLVANKQNSGVLHCNGGYAIANNVDYPETFSVAFRTDWDFVDISKKFTPLKLGMSGSYGLVFYSLSSDGRLRLYVYTSSVSNVVIASYKYSDIATNLNTGLNAFVLAITKDADGNFLPKLYVNGNLIENLSTTKVPAFAMGSGEFKLNSYTSANITAGDIAYQDVCLFGFDMSADDAPYTIADYQIGKSIPPSLKLSSFDVFASSMPTDWNITSSGSAQTNGQWTASTGVKYCVSSQETINGKTINATTLATNSVVSANASYNGLYYVNDISKHKGKTISFKYNGWVRKINDISTNEEALGFSCGIAYASIVSLRAKAIPYNEWTYISGEKEITISSSLSDAQLVFGFGCGADSSGNPIWQFADFNVSVVGATLALEDYTINGKVLDVSGNKNHATITGSVVGDYDTNVEAFVETIATLTSEQN